MAVNACGQKEEIRSVSALRPDKTNPEKFVCPHGTTRPSISPELQIDWTKVGTVAEAERQFQNYVLVQHGREKIVADYILALEGVNDICAINMDWQRDFYAGLDNPPQP